MEVIEGRNSLYELYWKGAWQATRNSHCRRRHGLSLVWIRSISMQVRRHTILRYEAALQPRNPLQALLSALEHGWRAVHQG